MTPCPPEDTLARMIDRTLTDGEFGPLEAHLEDCPVCQKTLDRLTAADDTAWLTPPSMTRTSSKVPVVPGVRIQEEIGRGGHGVVYRGYQPDLDRTVAVKVLRTGGLATDDERLRFAREALAFARLRHPNITQVHSVGSGATAPYLVLEFVPGMSLAARLADGPLPARDAAGVIEVVARAVQHAHDRGIVHRDLKPGNVLLDGGTLERPVVTDFGLARRLDDTDGPTATADALGTPSYMAPELAFGGAKTAGPAVDVYALGAVLYECLTGHPPFRGATPFETLLLVRECEPVPPRRFLPALDSDLEIVCLKCLEKIPADRYPSAEALASDLRRVLDRRPIAATRTGPVRRTVRWARRRPIRAAGFGVALAIAMAFVIGGIWHNHRLADERNAFRAEGLVRSLQAADTAGVPELIRALEPYRVWADSLLRETARDAPADSRERLHVALALAARDPAEVEFLGGRLLDARPAEVGVIAETLAGSRQLWAPVLWSVAGDPREDPRRRLRAAAALARFGPPDDPRFGLIAPALAGHLAAENPLYLSAWVAQLGPVLPVLISDLARVACDRQRPEAERLQAAAVLVSAGGDGAVAADTACDADPRTFATLFTSIREKRGESVPTLHAILRRRPTAGVTEAERVAQSDRQATAAIALARLGNAGPLWGLLDHSPDPTVRSILISKIGPYGFDPPTLAAQLHGRTPKAVCRAIVLAFGLYPPDAVSNALKETVARGLITAYRNDPDAGYHSAIDWLLRHKWGFVAELDRVDRELAGRPATRRRWFVDRQGNTLSVFGGPVTTVCGSPPEERHRNVRNEEMVRVRIPRTFAVSTREVTVGQFLTYRCETGQSVDGPWAEYASDDVCPASAVTPLEAMRYCRWLSRNEEFPEHEIPYPEWDADTQTVRLPEDYLSRTGYRLPTEAEWEHAARVGTSTPRFYGEGTDLMALYAWSLSHSDERSHPVGTRLPNDAGLFDVLGNVWDLCHPTDRSAAGEIIDDGRGVGFTPTGEEAFSGRGGSFLYLASFSRSAMRYPRPWAPADKTVGFRVARTIHSHIVTVSDHPK